MTCGNKRELRGIERVSPPALPTARLPPVVFLFPVVLRGLLGPATAGSLKTYATPPFGRDTLVAGSKSAPQVSMSKKRERDDGGSGDTFQEDIGAESLLFEIAPPPEDSAAKPNSSKRSKSSAADAPLLPQESAGSAGEGNSAASTAEPSKYHPAAIAPSSTLRQCDGLNVVKNKARGRGRQLMVLPGALGLGNGSTGGKMGTLNNAEPANPVLYVEFPEVREQFRF